jgi:cytochrome oxidase Cu insertion factor (SCO1/SenC/PrrC family)
MNKLILSIVFVAAAMGAVSVQAKKKSAAKATQSTRLKGSLTIGSSIPNAEVSLTSFDGRKITLQQEKKKKGLIVMFSCNTCPYVVKAQPRTREVMTQIDQMDIGMVVINSNEAQREDEDAPLRMREYAQIHQYTVPYVVDEGSRMADAFGATRTPEVFLFNAKGKLVYKGALEDNPAEPEKSTHGYLIEAMRALVEGKTITPAETKSIGCSIKRVAMK